MKKKNYLIMAFVLLGCVFSSYVQNDADIVFFENFDTTPVDELPAGWSQCVDNGYVTIKGNTVADGLRSSKYNNCADPYSGDRTLFHTKTNESLTTFTKGIELNKGVKYYFDCYVFSSYEEYR